MPNDIIVDANIFKSYYDLFINGIPSQLTDCPSKIFNNIGTKKSYIAVFDDSGIIKHEWENLVDYQWFEIWYSDMLLNENFRLTETQVDQKLESLLTQHGFPKGRDIIYVRTAKQVSYENGKCIFATEDLDFFDPKNKNSANKTRIRILEKSQGNVCKSLNKFNIFSTALCNF